MSMFSNLAHWAGGAWDRNRNFIGNAVKNVAPALVFVPGLGMVAAGAAGAAGRAMQKGSNFGDILKQGVTSAATGGAARGVVSGVQGAMSAAGRGAGASAGAGITPGASAALESPLPGYALTPGSAGAASVAAAAPAAPSAAGGFSLGGAARSLGGFARDNAAVIGQTGSGLLNARETGQQNDLRERQQNFEEQQYADEQARKKRLAELMAPLYEQMMASQQKVAPNPYAGH